MLFFDPTTLIAISNTFNAGSAVRANTQNQLRSSLSEGTALQHTVETLSHQTIATTLNPTTTSAISHALNTASVISTNIQQKLLLSLSADTKNHQAKSSGKHSHKPKSTTTPTHQPTTTPTPQPTTTPTPQPTTTPTPQPTTTPTPQPTTTPTPQPTTTPTPQPTTTPTPQPTQLQDTSKCGPGQPRDKYTRPFACDSIWNTPIGSNAKYVDAYIGSKGVGVDTDWFITTKDSDPLVPTYMPSAWGKGRCSGTIPQQQAQWHPEAGQPLNIPEDLIVADARDNFTPNNSAQILKPDGHTLVAFTTLTRCDSGGPLYGNWFGEQDIYGDGIDGGHGASGMSSIGGSIRPGELFNDNPIGHALKIDLWGQWLHYDPSSPTPGHRWPARLADFNAPNQYLGSNPALVMGSLLAIPPGVTAESLGLTSKVGKKIFQAMQDYGAYVVDDSGLDYNYLCLEHSAELEYTQRTGYYFNDDPDLEADFAKIIAAVKVVDNNGPNSIGGGGTPRQPLPPPIGN